MVGSGFGAAFAAWPLVRAGARVLMLERGQPVARGRDAVARSLILGPSYSMAAPIEVRHGPGRTERLGTYACVGGPSVFYGGVAMRFREDDFDPHPAIAGPGGVRWPLGYAELEPLYAEAERIVDVAGDDAGDPTAPWRSGPYPQEPASLSLTSARIAAAARALGRSPFRLPLAINHRPDGERPACAACPTCDTFACAAGAKNDVAVQVLPRLLAAGLELRPGTVAVRLVRRGDRVTDVECIDPAGGERMRFRGERVLVAAGALGSAHLLLASDLAGNPGAGVVGRFLTRHCAAIVFGLFRQHPEPVFHKQIAVHDRYRSTEGPLGSLQQAQTPPVDLVRSDHGPPQPFKAIGAHYTPSLTGLLAMAEDEPRARNRLRLDPHRRDAFGRPQAVVEHRYTRRDRRARHTLIGEARTILVRAGAWWTWTHRIDTYSHALGTVRMGLEPAASALDADCRWRGLENLHVVDGSALPSAAGVNPSLTIAANALRVGRRLAGEPVAAAGPAAASAS